MIPATLTGDDAAGCVWDCIVVGGGPAGTVAALGAARRGLQTLLIDRSAFPREKLCGGCLNFTARRRLESWGLGEPLRALAAPELNRFRLYAQGTGCELALPAGIAISRAGLDATLLQAAIDAGVAFLPETAFSGDTELNGNARSLLCRQHGHSVRLAARCVVLASGLANLSHLNEPELAVQTSARTRLGAGTSFPTRSNDYPAGTVWMAVTSTGYVGLTRLETGCLNVAAALELPRVQRDGVAATCSAILNANGLPVPEELAQQAWRGTAALTRTRKRAAGERLLVVGDAAGYVEPFTGEGMEWAIAGGQAAVPFLERAARAWHPAICDEWDRTLQRVVRKRQWICRLLSGALRSSTITNCGVQLISRLPAAGRWAVRQLYQGAEDEFCHLGSGNRTPV